MLETAQNHSNKSTALKILHRAACILAMLLAIYNLFESIWRFFDALEDLELLTDLGFTHSLQYFLHGNHFTISCFFSLLAVAQLILYVVLCRKVREGKPICWGSWVIAIFAAVHVLACIYTNLLPISREFPANDIEEIQMYYRGSWEQSLLPSVLCAVSYFVHLRSWKSNVANENCQST